MFELFIALLGGLFYAGKYANEKTASRSFDRDQKKWKATRDYIQGRYAASHELEDWARDFVLNGQHFEEICGLFADDFKYVFGAEWRSKLRIPPNPPVLDPRVYKRDAYSISIPCNHTTWVYHLLLAKRGKIDHWSLSMGFPAGGTDDRAMCIKFAECIERHLLDAGVKEARLVYEYHPHEETMKLESMCMHYPTRRLW